MEVVRMGGGMAAPLLLLVAAAVVLGVAQGQLRQGFYEHSCPRAEQIVKHYVQRHIPHTPSIAATLIRSHFHDCFVRGCDASVLLNGTNGNEAEKDATPNLTLRGFAFIDRVKSLVEQECPGVVSCADILALAARDAVGVIGGPFWRVPTGRRDGTVSIKQEALDQIPKPTMNFTELLGSFRNKSLDLADLVWLSGAHTIGISHCNNSFGNRLYNFTGRGGPGDADPTLDPLYAANLRKNKCTTPTDNTTIVEMDPGSFLTFDLGYYRGVLKHRGLFQSDAALITDATAKADILSVVNSPPEVFFQVFARSMVRMGMVDVKTGSEGEIRKHCALVNS